MAREKYGLVEWYIKQRGMDFDEWQGKSREEIKEVSSEKFFDKVIDVAKGKAPTPKKASTMGYLGANAKFKNESIKQIRGESNFENKANEFFNTQLRVIVAKTRLPQETKSDLISVIPQYNEEEQFEKRVREEEARYEEVEKAEQRKEEARKMEERRIARERRERERELEIRRQEREIAIREAEKFERTKEREAEIRRAEREIAREIAEGENEEEVLEEFEE